MCLHLRADKKKGEKNKYARKKGKRPRPLSALQFVASCECCWVKKKVTEDGVGRPSSLSVERGGGGCLQSGNLIALLKRER